VHPLNSEMRSTIEEHITAEYQKVADSIAAGSWTGPRSDDEGSLD